MPEPARLPIYDETVPITCTITEEEIPGRIATIERLRACLRAVERTPTGLLLRFPDRPDLRADVAAFTIDEKRCCQFWGFDTVDEPDGIALRWDGPPAAEDLLRRLETYFTTDAPLSILDGIL